MESSASFTETAPSPAGGVALDLTPLLAPRSVAVVGANDRPGSYADAVYANLALAGFDGALYGVNPKRDSVHGHPCVPTVADLPEAVDAVVVSIPAAAVPPVISAIGERGCGGAIVFAAGFAEVADGVALEAELTAAAAPHRLPVCGPNGNGVVAVHSRAPLWGDSVPELNPGRVAMISQSGNVAVNAIGSRRGIEFHTLVSTGNQAVLDASDWLAAMASSQDPPGSIAMFLEADGDGGKLSRALATCAERGIGVAVLKVGSSAEGARAAAAHTGALAGDQRVFRALIEEAGAAWAADPHELLELARALAEPRARPAGPGVAVLTCSGGDSGLAADEAARAGVVLPPLGDRAESELAELLPSAATIANPLDYTSLIWAETDRLRRIAAAVGDDPAVDLLLLCYDHPRGLSPEHEQQWAAVREGLAAGAVESGAAALFASTLPDLIDEGATLDLARRGVPTIAGLRSAIACAAALAGRPPDPVRLRAIAAAAEGASGSGDGRWLGEAEAKALLRERGVAVPDGDVAADTDGGIAIAARIGYPVAVKLSGAHLQHKSEAGALELGIEDEQQLRAACERLLSLPEAEGAQLLVERMADPGTEVMIAARGDAVVPALVIGLGGIWTEALDDVAIIPLPAGAERIEAAIRGLRGAAALTGARGQQRVDLAALCGLASAAADTLLEQGLALLELNPVIANAEGVTALDALARRA